MGTIRLLALLCTFATADAAALEPSPDRYDPARLHAIAVEHARAGDWAAARILLERAARLVPHDARIVRDLEEVRARRVPSPPPAAAPAPPPKPTGSPLLPEPPPLWVPKR